MKVRVILPSIRQTVFAAAVGVSLFIAPKLPAQAMPPPSQITTEAEVERVVVTGSHIPTAEEVGPNPVDTYRPQDIEKLGARNATDLLIKLPQQMGTTINQNANGAAGGNGSVIPNPKEKILTSRNSSLEVSKSGNTRLQGAICASRNSLIPLRQDSLFVRNHAVASRLAVALREGWSAKADRLARTEVKLTTDYTDNTDL